MLDNCINSALYNLSCGPSALTTSEAVFEYSFFNVEHIKTER